MKTYIYHYNGIALDHNFDGLLRWTHPIRTMDDYHEAKRIILDESSATGESYLYMMAKFSITSLSLLEVIDDED